MQKVPAMLIVKYSTSMKSQVPSASRSGLAASFRDVLFDNLLPFPLRFQDVFDRVAGSPVSPSVGRNPVGFGFDLGTRVFHGDRQPALAHGRQIDHIVAHESGFGGGDPIPFQNLRQHRRLVLDALIHVVHLQIARPQSNGFGDALSDDPGLDSRQPSQRNGGAVVGVEALGFDQAGAMESEAPLTALFPGLLENTLLSSRWLASGRGENPDFAVGENAVNVEENEFNFAGASGAGKFRHRRNSSRGRPARVGTGSRLACHEPVPEPWPASASRPAIGGNLSLAGISPLCLHINMCNNVHMATNLALDDRLIEEARRAGKHKTKKEAVNAALDEYVRRRKQMKIVDSFGTVTFDPAYDYKAERRRSSRRARGQSRP